METDVSIAYHGQRRFLNTTIRTLHGVIRTGDVNQEYLDFIESVINGIEYNERVRNEQEQSMASTPDKKHSDSENDDQSDSMSLEVWSVGECTDSDSS